MGKNPITKQLLFPLREADDDGADRRWSLDRTLEELKAVRSENGMLKDVQA